MHSRYSTLQQSSSVSVPYRLTHRSQWSPPPLHEYIILCSSGAVGCPAALRSKATVCCRSGRLCSPNRRHMNCVTPLFQDARSLARSPTPPHPAPPYCCAVGMRRVFGRPTLPCHSTLYQDIPMKVSVAASKLQALTKKHRANDLCCQYDSNL